MCNDYEQHIRWSTFEAFMERTEAGIAAQAAVLPCIGDIRIGDTGAALRASGNAVELAPMTFGFPPPRPKRPRVFNFISEKRDFSQSKRCAIAASAFFEFTGKKYPKAKHRFTLKDGPLLFIAGLWREGEGEADSFTMLTTAPGEDIAPYHDRQVVVLPPDRCLDWLYLTRPQAELLRPLEPGRLAVETVRAGTD